jgi:hypothetical protein
MLGRTNVWLGRCRAFSCNANIVSTPHHTTRWVLPLHRCVHLHEGGDEAAPLESYIAVACASAFGEDYPALGRLLLLQVRAVCAGAHHALNGGETGQLRSPLSVCIVLC